MNSLTSILLKNFRVALDRHGRDVTLVSLRAGATGRGNYIAAEGRRDNDEAVYEGLRVLRGGSSDDVIGMGTGDYENRTYSCLMADLPLVDGKRLIPTKGWVITDLVSEGSEITQDFYVNRPGETAVDGNVVRISCGRKR